MAYVPVEAEAARRLQIVVEFVIFGELLFVASIVRRWACGLGFPGSRLFLEAPASAPGKPTVAPASCAAIRAARSGLLLRPEDSHQQQHDRLGDVDHRPGHRAFQDARRFSQVSLNVAGAALRTAGDQCPRVREDHRAKGCSDRRSGVNQLLI